MANEINKVGFLDYCKVDKNFFDEDKKATSFLLNQLNAFGDEIFEGNFCWFGEECVVPANVLNSVLRSLEAVGASTSVIVVPCVIGGPGPQKYIMKPYLYNPEYPVKVGIAVTSELEAEKIISK